MDRARSRAIGLAIGLLADHLLGDPRRWHPVAGIGRWATMIERRTHRDDHLAGAVHLVAVAAPVVGAAVMLERATEGHAVRHAVATAATVWAATGASQLGDIGLQVQEALLADDLVGARALMPSLVGRDTQSLTGPDMVRATVESIAENTADATVGPLVWGALAGIPGVAAHRVVNTLDAMVGHRTARYARFGTASARTDDLLGFLPARVTAGLTVAVAPCVGGSPAEARRAWRSDAHRHPSPNAGPVEAAAAGALGCQLGGPTRYSDRVEVRGPYGRGRPPGVMDIGRSVHLARCVVAAAAVLSVAVASAR